MIYVYAPSYQTIWYALSNFDVQSMVVISHNSRILNFCAKLSISTMEQPVNDDSSFAGILKHKQKVQETFAAIAGQEVVFCFNTFDVWGIYLMHILGKNNRVYFNPIEFNFRSIRFSMVKAFRQPEYRLKLMDKLVYFMALRIWYNVFEVKEGYYCLGLTKKRLKRRYAAPQDDSSKGRLQQVKQQISVAYAMEQIDVAWIDSPAFHYSYSGDLVAKILSSISNHKAAVKQHPTFELSSEALATLEHFPREIPVEFIDFSACKLIIGVHSNAMKPLAKDLTVCSLYHLVEWNNPAYGAELFSQHIDDPNILTPKSITELEQILIEKMT